MKFTRKRLSWGSRLVLSGCRSWTQEFEKVLDERQAAEDAKRTEQKAAADGYMEKFRAEQKKYRETKSKENKCVPCMRALFLRRRPQIRVKRSRLCMHPLPVTAQSSFGIDSRMCDRAAEAEYIAARANDISTGTPFEQVVRVGSFDFREGTRLRQATRTSRHLP